MINLMLAAGLIVGNFSNPPSAYQDITFWLNWENDVTGSPYTMLTTGATRECSGTSTISSGDTTGTFDGDHSATDPGAYVKTLAAKTGTYGLHVQGDGTPNFNWETVTFSNNAAGAAIIDPVKGCILVTGYRVSSTAETFFRTQVGSGKVSCGWSGTECDCLYEDATTACGGLACTQEVLSTGSACPTAAWRTLEFCWNTTTSPPTTAMRVFNDAGQVGTTWTLNTPAISSAGASWGLVTVGAANATPSIEAYYDTIAISSDPTRDLQALRSQVGCPR